MSHESTGKSDDWYTPKFVFDKMEVWFDMDCASSEDGTFVPCSKKITSDSLNKKWIGFIWLNPPFGGRNGLDPWIKKFIEHGNGLMLTPDRTSTDWCQDFFEKCQCVLFVRHKIKFIRPDGTSGDQPSNGTCIFGIGDKAVLALKKAEENGLGKLFFNSNFK